LQLVALHRPRVCVELGTWRGASAIAIARLLAQWGGVLTCVDTWTGDVNGGTVAGPPHMLLECAANVVSAGVAPWVRFLCSTTAEAARTWAGPIDFLYVDADHRYEAVLGDLLDWWPHVRRGGLIAGDDFDNPDYPGVREAWEQFEREVGLGCQRYATPGAEPMRLIYGLK